MVLFSIAHVGVIGCVVTTSSVIDMILLLSHISDLWLRGCAREVESRYLISAQGPERLHGSELSHPCATNKSS